MPNIAYVNGKWSALSSAKVSVEDRGFQFADGVYELIRTYHGAVFHLQEHLKRLYQSLSHIEMDLKMSPDQLAKIVQTGVKKCGYPEVKIYIQVTRGVAPRLHHFPKGVQPTLVMTFRRLTPVPKVLSTNGVAVISVLDTRWNCCNVKSLNLLSNIIAREQAVRVGAYEAIFVRDRFVLEGAGSNIFAVFGKKAVTPPEGPTILSGITRDIVLSLGKPLGLKMSEGKLTLPLLKKADELFLTGTTVDILPVVQLDRQRIGSGSPGKITLLLQEAFKKAAKEH
ncbi:MAG: aminotransferase class IV [Nitrospirota bacterium]